MWSAVRSSRRSRGPSMYKQPAVAICLALEWQYTLNSGKIGFYCLRQHLSEYCNRDSLPLSEMETRHDLCFVVQDAKRRRGTLGAPSDGWQYTLRSGNLLWSPTRCACLLCSAFYLVERQVEFQVETGPGGGVPEVALEAEEVVPGGESPAGERHDGRFQAEFRGERRASLVQGA